MDKLIERAILRVAAEAGFQGCEEAAYSLSYCQSSYVSFAGCVRQPSALFDQIDMGADRTALESMFGPQHDAPASIKIAFSRAYGGYGHMDVSVDEGSTLDESDDDSGHDQLLRYQAQEALQAFEKRLVDHAKNTALKARSMAYQVSEACDPTWWAGDAGETVYRGSSRHLLLQRREIGSIEVEFRLHEMGNEPIEADEAGALLDDIVGGRTVIGMLSCHVLRHNVEIGSSYYITLELPRDAWQRHEDFRAALKEVLACAINSTRENLAERQAA